MSDKKIKTPRPFYDYDQIKKGKKKEILSMGTKDSGIVIGVTKEGVEVTGYYKGFSLSAPTYAVLRKAIKIDWNELEKVRDKVSKRKKTSLEPDRIEREPDEKYLKELPKVHINDELYYIDSDRRERRSVKNPSRVFKF